MEGDRFISTTRNIPEKTSLKSEVENNFFVQTELKPLKTFPLKDPIKHINDYDSNIMQEEAYKDVNDDVFKLEYKISKIEEELKTIDTQIETALEIKDFYMAENLNNRKSQLTQELSELSDLYKETSISAKISGDLTSKVKSNVFSLQMLFEKFVGNVLISKLPNKLFSIMKIRESLGRLENINQSIDELVKSRYASGEAIEKYEQLSKYIAKANSIQADIYKFIK